MTRILDSLPPLIATGAVLSLGIGVAIAGGTTGSGASAPAVAGDHAADEMAAHAAPPAPAGTVERDAATVLPEFIGSCSAGGPVRAAGMPAGATVYRWVNGTYPDAGDRRAVRAAVAGVAQVPEKSVDCFDGGATPMTAAEGAKAGDTSASAPSTSSRAPEGSGTCQVDWTPGVTLPSGATITASVSGQYVERTDEDRMRAIVARISGRPADTVTCAYWVPPIGSCMAELRPAPGTPVPDGATAYGNVGGEYTERGQVAALRAALASMAGLDPADITCEDFPAPDVAAPEPMPIEPGAGGPDTPVRDTP